MVFTKGHKINLGRGHTHKTKNKISLFNKGNIPRNKGKKGLYTMSEESRKKISETMTGKYRGANNKLWKGGSKPYTTDWTETLRRSIRERDHYTCKMCGELQSDIAHDVHHIDHVKENCSPDNLITLCHICHSKIQRTRKEWIGYFKNHIDTINGKLL